MLLPSGDQSAPEASVEMLVILRASPVSDPLAESKSLQPDLRAAVFRRFKDEALAVGRETRTIFTGAGSGSEPAGFAAGDGHDPQMRRAGVGFEADIDRAEGDPFAVGRDNRLADALELHHVVEGEGTLGLGESGNREREQEESYKDATKHKPPRAAAGCWAGSQSCKRDSVNEGGWRRGDEVE